MSDSPKWLRFLERRIGWIAIPQIAIILVTLQVLGFLFVMQNPAWIGLLDLNPYAVAHGEYWRLITFLALPLSMSPLWLFFTLWFLYFVVQSLESEWGAFRTTFYVLIYLVLTAVFSFLTGFPVTHVTDFESSLFLAAAMLFPEVEIRIFFAIPAKLKWLGWLAGAYIIYRFLTGSNFERIYLLVVYANFILFFWPAAWNRWVQILRRWRFKRKSRF